MLWSDLVLLLPGLMFPKRQLVNEATLAKISNKSKGRCRVPEHVDVDGIFGLPFSATANLLSSSVFDKAIFLWFPDISVWR